ncbi:MAG: hypothetical protein J0I63_00855 [Thiobacillus sp.]|nr:hypothetical protein [Thiobacillus sp.]
MDWLAQNWIWVVFFVLFIGMHLFGHGGHGGGGHGGHSGHGGGRDEQEPAGGEQPGRERPQGHHH